MSIVRIDNHVRHADVDQVREEVATWEDTGESITDNAAQAIASWYQSPSAQGMPFTSLASGAALDTNIFASIEREIAEATDGGDVLELKALGSYVEDYLMHKGYSPCVAACGEWLKTDETDPVCAECAELDA